MIPISIVVPNFNSGTVLHRSLLSLRAQNYASLQIILVDSLSTDESRDIIEQSRDWLDVVISEKDQGQADGLNKGFRHASGEVLGWLCADDELTAAALQHVSRIFEEDPGTDVVLGACERRFPDGSTAITPARPDAWQVIGMQNVIDQPSMFWKRSLHQRLGDLNTSYRLAFDWDFWCRMRDARARLRTTDQVLSVYHFSGGSQSNRAGRLHAHESFRILRSYGPGNGLLAYVFRFLYMNFDLHGCYDRPPACTPARARMFAIALMALRLMIGRKLLYSYNWHFASCQERGLQWWL